MDKERLKANKKHTRPIRLLRRDGELNIDKDSLNSFRIFNLLITMTWQRLFFYAFAGYVMINILFSIVYWLIGGAECLAGMNMNTKFWYVDF